MTGAPPRVARDKIRLLKEAKAVCEDLANSPNDLLANRALLARWHLRNILTELEVAETIEQAITSQA